VVQAVLQAAAAQVAAHAAPQACHHEANIQEQHAIYQLGLQAVQPPAAAEGQGRAHTQCQQLCACTQHIGAASTQAGGQAKLTTGAGGVRG
jgi:hypothetical protein